MEALKSQLTEFLNREYVERLLLLFFVLIGIFILISLVKRALNKNITDADNKYLTRKALNIIGFFLALGAVLLIYNDKLGGIGVALGVAGAGIAFALQEVIMSVAGWFSIMLGGLIKTGTRIKVDNIVGDVIDIGILKTTVMETNDWIDGDLYNGRMVTLANSFVFKYPVHNYSAEYPFLWDEITVPVRTESDYNHARKLFREVLVEVCGDYAEKSVKDWNRLTNKYRVEKANIEPMVHLEFDENWITFTLRYIVDYKLRRSTKDRIYTRLLEEIKKHDDIIMIATTSVEITNVSGDKNK